MNKVRKAEDTAQRCKSTLEPVRNDVRNPRNKHSHTQNSAKVFCFFFKEIYSETPLMCMPPVGDCLLSSCAALKMTKKRMYAIDRTPGKEIESSGRGKNENK